VQQGSQADVLAEIRGRIDIVDLISQYLPLRRSGDNYRALCPFHNEKKPSFNVSRSKQIFYCFGCKKGGDIFNFLVLHEGLTFWESVRTLADRAGVELPSGDGQVSAAKAVREKIAELNNFAAGHFRSNLAKSSRGRQYLTNRKVPKELWEQFGLGYASDTWSGLYEAARGAGFSDQILVQAGLVKERVTGGYYDLFRDRVMFPIAEVSGKVVGFGGRAMSDDDVKYINSPESPLYHKGGSLYGIYQAKEAFRRTQTAYVVEGYFDLIMVVGAGVRNAVASLGTALTEEQTRLLKRYVSRVVLLYDTDEAGINAALRGVEVLLSCDLAPRLVRLPAGKDPDDFIRSNGAEKFCETVGQQSDFLDFLIAAHTIDRADIETKIGVARRGFALIEKVKNELKRSEYLKLFAEKLNMSEKAMRAEFSKALTRRVQPKLERAEPKLGELEGDLLKVLIDRQDLVEQVREHVEPEQIDSDTLRRFVKMLLDAPAGQEDMGRFLMDSVTDPETRELLASVLIRELITENPDKAVADWIQSVQRVSRQREAEQLQKEIQIAERNGDTAKLMKLLKQKEELVGGSS